MLPLNKVNFYLRRFGIKVSAQETLIIYDEEFGYKQSAWVVPLTGKALEKWWLSNKSISKIVSIGKFYPIYNKNYSDSESLFDGSAMYDYSKAEAWYILRDLPVYYCHVFTDDDSFLRTPTNRHIHHAGYHQAWLEAEKRIEETRNDSN